VTANQLEQHRLKAIIQSQRQARRLSYGVVPAKGGTSNRRIHFQALNGPAKRPLLALGNGHWPECRASDHLRALRRGGDAIEDIKMEMQNPTQENYCTTARKNCFNTRVPLFII
jgi:hypothetical protein